MSCGLVYLCVFDFLLTFFSSSNFELCLLQVVAWAVLDVVDRTLTSNILVGKMTGRKEIRMKLSELHTVSLISEYYEIFINLCACDEIRLCHKVLCLYIFICNYVFSVCLACINS